MNTMTVSLYLIRDDHKRSAAVLIHSFQRKYPIIFACAFWRRRSNDPHANATLTQRQSRKLSDSRGNMCNPNSLETSAWNPREQNIGQINTQIREACVVSEFYSTLNVLFDGLLRADDCPPPKPNFRL